VVGAVTFSAEHLAPFADRLCASREVEEPKGRANGTFTAQPQKGKGLHRCKPLI
jgi:hypothetical protein